MMSTSPEKPLRSAEFQTVTAQMDAILGTSDKIIVKPAVVEPANDPVSAKTNRFVTWMDGLAQAKYDAWDKAGSIKGSL
jgi:hypothetical protein